MLPLPKKKKKVLYVCNSNVIRPILYSHFSLSTEQFLSRTLPQTLSFLIMVIFTTDILSRRRRRINLHESPHTLGSPGGQAEAPGLPLTTPSVPHTTPVTHHSSGPSHDLCPSPFLQSLTRPLSLSGVLSRDLATASLCALGSNFFFSNDPRSDLPHCRLSSGAY